MTQLLELLTAMKSHAERERSAVRSLQPRQLFELATEGETLARRLAQLLAKTTGVTPEVTKRAGEVRALARANAELVRRSLDVIKAVKSTSAPTGGADTPAFISRVA